MMKLLGFVVAMSIIMLALRPSMIFGTRQPDATPPPTPDAVVQRNLNAVAVSNPTPEASPTSPSTQPEKEASTTTKTVEYAEGYDAKSFGKAFEDPLEGTTKEALTAEPEGTWKILLKLTFDVKFDERVDDIVFAPIFTPAIRKLAGKEIVLQGYILPHDITKMGGSNAKQDGSMFIFSAFPAATCFYCGGAGPESVIEVYPASPIPFSKQMVTIKGKLELNETDFLQLAYKLKQAKLAN